MSYVYTSHDGQLLIGVGRVRELLKHVQDLSRAAAPSKPNIVNISPIYSPFCANTDLYLVFCISLAHI